jgi:hypothetical protein
MKGRRTVPHHRQAGALGLLLAMALGLTACQGESADFVPPPTAPPTGSPTPATATTTSVKGAGELTNATVAMQFRRASYNDACPSTPLKYTDGQHMAEFTMAGGGTSIFVATIGAAARVDVDRDGTEEIIAKAQCMDGDGEDWKIFALRPDRKGGFAAFAVVVEHDRGTGGEIGTIGDLAVTSAGEVIVNVGNNQQEFGGPPPVWQSRTYAWNGQAFTQTAGPTTFTGDPAVASFTVTSQLITLSAPSGDYRNGTISITVKALGPQTVTATLLFMTAQIQARSGGDWSRCQHEENDYFMLCDLGTLAAGSQATFTLPFRTHVDGRANHPDGRLGSVSLREGIYEHEPVTIKITNP